ncbi:MULTISPECIES: arsenate reductase ArsC [Shewanella]|jgi:arsenate reductase|uniref:arsenate reductase ArsC n=1 Tax=Shewanella TaxID=22 RepID=UPI000DB36248|nr:MULTISPECIES: arsenate reductase ArsC [Shewanella]MBB1391968.1 arsenate reductase ArsC [Shewanella sp. SG44-6]MCS6160766.1 arsenate reductase ArsC [Shewanella baltica]PZP34981.1 MAG: arsenate reductase ArsC [Shewanella oneidensis]
MAPAIKVLFLCTHNACRSILAEAIGRDLVAKQSLTTIGQWQFSSAGSEPAGVVHPQTLLQLAHRGYVTEGLSSKSWDMMADFTPDLVITVCDNAAGETCPLWLGQTLKLHWGLPDPTSIDAPDIDEQFSYVIETLENRIKALISLPLSAGIETQKASLQSIASQFPLIQR